MAVNPKLEALWQNIGFIQESMATSGLPTIASHLKELDLITRQNYYDLAACAGSRGPVDQAAMLELMTSVEVKIRDNPDVYFTRFIEALRRSHLGYVADRLVQALPEDQRHGKCVMVISHFRPLLVENVFQVTRPRQFFSDRVKSSLCIATVYKT